MIECGDTERCSSPSVLLETYDIHPEDALSIKLRVKNSNKYPAKQHARRVADKLQASAGLIYLPGQSTVPLEDSDQDRDFRQRRYFFYLCGVNEPDCHLAYDIESDTLTLFVPDFDLKRAIWMGPTLGLDEAMKKYDIDEVKYYSSLEKYIWKWGRENNDSSPIYVLHDSQKPVCALLSWWFDSDSLLPAMDACRVIKDDYEIGMIRRANEVSAAAHRAVLSRVKSMETEAEIEGTFLDTCISHGAHSQSYAIIAASGENAATLHYTKNNESFGNRQFVCLDAGAEWNCYASDVTRTFPLKDAWPSTEARAIYGIVEEMQEACIKRIKPGRRYLDLHILAHNIAIERLQQLGILKGGSIYEIQKSGASLVFFPHGLGHHVGLEVHDVSPQSLMAWAPHETAYYGSVIGSPMHLGPCTLSGPVLEAGMVLTVEPGIYFSELALKHAQSQPLSQYIDMDVVKRYIPVGGVRIEDDILVTEQGYENLTTAPKGEAMLDIIRGG